MRVNTMILLACLTVISMLSACATTGTATHKVSGPPAAVASDSAADPGQSVGPQKVVKKVDKRGLSQMTQVQVRDKASEAPMLETLDADGANVALTKVDVVVPPPEPTHRTTYAIGTAVGGAVIGTVLFLLSDSDDDKPTKTEVTSSYWREHQAR